MHDSFVLTHADIYRQGRFAPGEILCLDGVIRAAGGSVPRPEGVPVVDGGGLRAIPGMIDIHTHGAAGVDINTADEEALERLAAFFAARGVTAWNASVLTDTPEQTLAAIGRVRRACARGGHGAQLLGVHLEGPFLSPQYKGAMPEKLLQKGSEALARRFADAAGDCLRYVTLAPEVEGVEALIPFFNERAAVALGHSGASYEQSMRAFQLGARAVTHTFNGMILFHHHSPGLMGAALESDVYCEAICDGLHLHPGTVRMLIKCKGWDRVAAVTDSIMAAGLPDGRYRLGVNDVIVKDGDARLAQGDSRAGSTLTMHRALKNLMAFTGQPLEKVLPLLTENPARLLRIGQKKGRLEEGLDGDLVLLDEKNEVRATYVKGKCVYRQEQAPA